MTRARNLAGLGTVTAQPTVTTPVHLGPLGVVTATKYYGTFDHTNIIATSIATTDIQISGITTGLNVSGIITAQNGLDVTGNIVNGLNVSAGIATLQALTATTGTFTGNVSIAGTLTYEDITDIDSVGVGTFRRGIVVSGVSTFLSNQSGVSVTGVGSFGGDVSIADKIIHTGDTNTALRFPAADTITAETAGSERLRITSAGDMGMDSSPANYSNYKTFTVGAGSVGSIIELRGTTSNFEHLIQNNDGDLIFEADLNNAKASTNIVFKVDNSERVRINSSGLVGINTNTPTALLSFGVQRSTQTYPPICFQAAYGTGLADAAISTTDDSGGVDIMMGSNVYMGQNGTFTRYFSSYGSAAVRCQYTGNTIFYNKSGNNAPVESMRIDGSGKLGIGDNSPTTIVDIKVTDTTAYDADVVTVGQNQLRINNAGASGVAGIRFDAEPSSGSAGYASIRTIAPASGSADLIFSTRSSSTFAERLRILADGRVGINDSSPERTLDVNGDIMGVAFMLKSNSSPSGSAQSQIYKPADNQLAFATNGANERLRINSSGVIVAGNGGTNFGNASIQSFIAHGATAGESAFSAVDTTSVAAGVGGEIAFHGKYNTGAQDYAYLGHIRGIKENATAGNTACALTFYTRPDAVSPQERLRITSSGQLVVGHTADAAPDGYESLIQVNSANHTGSIQIGRHTANANGPSLLFLKTRSGTAAPGTGVVSDDDTLGVIRWYGSDGTDLNSSAAEITCHVDTTPGTNDMPGRIQMGTTPDGESSPKESFRLDRTNSITGGAGGITHVAMDNLTTGYAHMPSWTQGANNLAGDVWTTVLNVGTSEATWDLVSFEGSTNSGLWCEVTCYFSQITAGKAGRQRVSYRIMRTGNNNFGTSVDGPYDKVGADTNDHFTPSITTTGTGSNQRCKLRITTVSLLNYCMTMYHIRWVAGDYMTAPYIIV